MTSEMPCALAGCPAGRKTIVALTIYFFCFFAILAISSTWIWTIIEGALHTAMAPPKGDGTAIQQGLAQVANTVPPTMMENVVGTVGTREAFAAQLVKIGNKTVLAIPDSLAALAVMASGAFGGLIHSIRSMYYHVIEGDFGQADAIKLFLRPFSGAILALLFYLVLRAGFGDGVQKAEDGASIIFYVAVGGIVGMFTDQTVSKLKKIAEAILTKPEEKDSTTV